MQLKTAFKYSQRSDFPAEFLDVNRWNLPLKFIVDPVITRLHYLHNKLHTFTSVIGDDYYFTTTVTTLWCVFTTMFYLGIF